MKDMVLKNPETGFTYLAKADTEGMTPDEVMAELKSGKLPMRLFFNEQDIEQLGDFYSKANCMPSELTQAFGFSEEDNPQIKDALMALLKQCSKLNKITRIQNSSIFTPASGVNTWLVSYSQQSYLISGSIFSLRFGLELTAAKSAMASLGTFLPDFVTKYRPRVDKRSNEAYLSYSWPIVIKKGSSTNVWSFVPGRLEYVSGASSESVSLITDGALAAGDTLIIESMYNIADADTTD